ncbi:TetR/AcrR family transcriptional regulator [Streptomyces sp. 8L]|uniref:TetR/AcrR family transcriptional regulator n=1 Tax=Streptomyces sp. 8L TaxID=2877242 RepID=UPI001CD73784|nr:TetR/AcrR family transcriptional regulator [Streptomyces sp. 8L]MCA1217084.1 TetR/AcrR family transcriptional regulator [Streptomyces sp. 8L]
MSTSPSGAASEGARTGRAGKRRAITRGARTVFGREGYARTSIEAIAAEAGVSTRTIYNHFEGKEALFSDVVHESAGQVADAFAERAREAVKGADPRGDLIALGLAHVGQRTHFPEHFAMVRQIKAEAGHFPPAVIDTWQQAGPRRVQREVADRLAAMAAAGHLRIGDPSTAALHFVALVSSEITLRPYGSASPAPKEVAASVARGVDAFLHGYGAEGGSAG